MDTQEFVNLFINTTGELLYFIALFVAYQAALLMAFDQSRRSRQETSAKRYVLALIITEAAWLTLIGGAILSVIADDNTNIMPPLERAVNAIVFVALSWGLLSAEYDGPHFNLSRTLSAGLVGLFIIGFGATVISWDSTQDFNHQVFSTSWTLVPLILSVVSIFLLFSMYKNIADIPLKALFFLLIGIGHGYALLQLLNESLDGDAAGAVRWSYMVGGALVVVLVYRMVMDRMTSAVEEVASYAESISKPFKTIPPAEVEATNIAPEEFLSVGAKVKAVTAGTSSLGGRNESLELLKALGIMLDQSDTEALPKQIVVAVAETLKVDIVALVSYDDANWADLLAAYDNTKKKSISGISLNLGDQPTLLNAIESKQQRQLSFEDNPEELRDLYTRLDILQNGPTYFQPLTRHNKVVGALIVGFPYTRRELRPNELRLMESVGPIAARLMVISRQAMINRIEAEERAILEIVEGSGITSDIIDDAAALAIRLDMQQSLDLAQKEINELTKTIQDLQHELDRERGRLAELVGADDDEAMSITQRIEVIANEREILQHERQQLTIALKEARATLAGATAENESGIFNSVIDSMRQELTELRTQKERLEQQLATLRQEKTDSPAVEKLREVLNTVTVEKTQLAVERNSLQQRLSDTQGELEAIGIEGGIQGLALQMTRLTEERTYYKTLAERAAIERDTLLRERQKLQVAIAQETEREARITALEDEIERLIQDREAYLKGRDNLKAEREALLNEREHWQSDRARMLAHNDALKMELDETLELLSVANKDRQELSSERNQTAAERDMLRVDLNRMQNERDTLMARVEGNRERVQEIGQAGVGTMQTMIENLTQERSALEAKLLKAQEQVEALQIDLHRAAVQGEPDEVQGTPAINMEVIISLAQELRTPLSVILGLTETVLNESVGILGALQRTLLTRVKANVDRLGYLVEELVQVVALDTGDLKLHPQNVNLVDIIDDAIMSSRYKFSEKGIVIDLDIQQDTLYVEADVEALRQVINHLIQNAYLVSPTDGIVRVGAYMTDSVIRVEVEDRGGGIDPQDQKRVFSRLYRADNPLISGLGDTGVGMSITKALIEAHQGKIWLNSQQGVGNTFKLELPTRQRQPNVEKSA
ncbi:MAG: hypothetical protein H6673_03670 [Anaerolineales bacterium]|nr:hypothetical protein [Anaerolineales bacterium]